MPTMPLCAAQVVLLIRQMEATATQAAVAKVSLLTVGQQAIMDAYLCLLHLTTGVLSLKSDCISIRVVSCPFAGCPV